MSETLEPGLYKATVRGVADVTVLVDIHGTGSTSGFINDNLFHASHDITDARPLIILDLGDHDPAHYITVLRNSADRSGLNLAPYVLKALADQIEAQTKPARIPEPGLWGVVEAGYTHSAKRLKWVHARNLSWQPIDSTLDSSDIWKSLIDPVLIREGIN